jgi:hypothetical protein
METDIKEFLSGVKIGAKQSHANMTLFCLLSTTESPLDFLTLDEALKAEALIISEVSQSGSVPELSVSNRSKNYVLLLDGEELVGAKQNRVLNVTILIAPESETIIPVSCVEQGRWSYRSRHFGSHSRAMSAKLRKVKSETVAMNLMHHGVFASDQGRVWNEIADKYERMSADQSPTMAMADLYDQYEHTSREYMKAFHPVESQIGMIVFIDGVPAGMELLNKMEAFIKIHSKLINSYVMDALETAPEQSKSSTLQSLKNKAGKLMDSVQNARATVRKSVAMGNDLRLESPEVSGGGLEFNGRLLHLSMFPREAGRDEYRERRMAPASRRRNMRRE